MSEQDTNLPRSWVWTTIGEVTQARVEQAPPDGGPSFLYVDISSIDNSTKKIVDPKNIPVAEAPSRARQRLKTNDVLVSMTRPNLNAVAILPPEFERAIGSTGFDVLRTEWIEPPWLLYFVQTNEFIQAMSRLVQGVLYPAVRPKDIRSYQLPLAPLPEQKRIIAEVEKQFTRLDAAVAALKRVQTNLKRYRAAVLKAAVEGRLVPTEAELARREGRSYEPASELLKRILAERRSRWEANQLAKFRASGKQPKDSKWEQKYKEPGPPETTNTATLPEGWSVASLEQLTNPIRVICYGILMPKENMSDGIPYVRVLDLKGDRINVSGLRKTSVAIAAAYARASLEPGDILLAIRGSYGRVAEVPAELRGGNITQDTARLDVTKEVDHRFVATHLRSPVAQNYFKRVARGVAVKGVNIADVRICAVNLPPLHEQQRIVTEVEQRTSIIDELEMEVEADLKRADRLRQAILKRAFEGKLVPQDATDEPASVLLERIRAERQKAAVSPRILTRKEASYAT